MLRHPHRLSLAATVTLASVCAPSMASAQTPGPPQTVSAMGTGEVRPSGPFGSDQGTFGPGQFCGRVARYRTRRGPSGRIISRTRIGSRRLCRVPSRVFVAVTVTYSTTPKP